MANSIFLNRGDVVGPASATDGNLAVFDGTTGKLIKDGGAAPAGTVSSVSVTTGNGVSGTVATATTTPAITLTLGAITPSSVAASGDVSDSVGSMASLRLGALGLTSQATGDLISASSATQLSRIAAAATGKVLQANTGASPSYSTATYPSTAGTSGNVLTSDGTNWLSSTPSSSKYTLLKASSGTSSAAGTTTLDSIAISGLTALDTLVIDFVADSQTQDTAGFTAAYSTTDSTAWFAAGTITAGSPQGGRLVIQKSPSGAGAIFVNPGTNAGITRAIVTTATSWLGSFTLAIRHTGVTPGGTLNYKWAVYKEAGQ